jgi:monofunctional chorismate mutase
MGLEDLRNEIDKIDSQIVNLLKQRFDCSLEIANYKKENSLPVLNSEREKEILEKVKKTGEEHGENIAAVYEAIMSLSKKAQEKAINGK